MKHPLEVNWLLVLKICEKFGVHQKRREDMKDVARESQDRMINAVF